ncbi:MAG: hypothetical protein KJT01_11690, partial [Gemmatimonadetes bacterium]|nr:hypothetical protein [Gemmatimonadota bacterium]
MPNDPQLFQLLVIFGLFASFGMAEVLAGKFFPPEAGHEDDRLDVAVGLMFPVVASAVYATTSSMVVVPSATFSQPSSRRFRIPWERAISRRAALDSFRVIISC